MWKKIASSPQTRVLLRLPAFPSRSERHCAKLSSQRFIRHPSQIMMPPLPLSYHFYCSPVFLHVQVQSHSASGSLIHESIIDRGFVVSSLLWCSGFHDQFYSTLQYVDIHFSGMTRAAAHSTSILTSPVTKIINDRSSIIFFLKPPFFVFLIEFTLHLHAARLLDKLGVGTQECRVRSLLFPLWSDCNHNNDGLVCGAELRGTGSFCPGPLGQLRLFDPGRVWSASSRRRASLRNSTGAATGRVYCVLHHSEEKSSRRLGEKFGAFAFVFFFCFAFSCVWHYISLYLGVGVAFLFLFSVSHQLHWEILGLGAILYTPNASALARQNVRFWERMDGCFSKLFGVFLLFFPFFVQHLGQGVWCSWVSCLISVLFPSGSGQSMPGS